MSRRPSHIPLRRPIYVGCEGRSEVGYAGLLLELVRAAGLAVHLHIDEYGTGTGDPLSRIEIAVIRLKRLEKRRSGFKERFALLDSDQTERDPQRARRAESLADANGIRILWQDPCFEGLLLRHLPDRATHRPPDTARANQALLKEWPEYRKPMSRLDLARRIDTNAIARAATVEPGLAALLRCIGLI